MRNWGTSQSDCGNRHKVPWVDEFTCTLPPGHKGSHEDDDGHWWPRDDELENW
jgi:hypothetical protein